MKGEGKKFNATGGVSYIRKRGHGQSTSQNIINMESQSCLNKRQRHKSSIQNHPLPSVGLQGSSVSTSPHNFNDDDGCDDGSIFDGLSHFTLHPTELGAASNLQLLPKLEQKLKTSATHRCITTPAKSSAKQNKVNIYFKFIYIV